MTFSWRRLRLLFVLALFLVAIAGFYVRYFLTRPVGEGPAGPPVARQPFHAAWSPRSIHVVGIGDSVTAGLGAKSLDHSYFQRLLVNPPDEFPELQGCCLKTLFPNLTWENLAISGSTSDQHLEVIEDKLQTRDPSIFGLVFMTSGGNDLIHSYGRSKPRECAMYGANLDEAKPWIENFRIRLQSMLSRIESAFPGGCEIFIADIYDPTDGVGDGVSIYLPAWPDGLAIHAEYNRTIQLVASERSNVHVVPLYRTFLGHGSHCRQFWRATYDAKDPHYWFYSNVEDPNDRGYDAIRRVFLNTFLEKSSLRNE